jgi:hypothetical protein
MQQHAEYCRLLCQIATHKTHMYRTQNVNKQDNAQQRPLFLKRRRAQKCKDYFPMQPGSEFHVHVSLPYLFRCSPFALFHTTELVTAIVRRKLVAGLDHQ